MMRKLIVALLVGLTVLTGCSTDADVASKNLSQDADNFKILRRVVFFNGITDRYLLEIDGYCSVDNSDPRKLAVTCKIGDQFKKHFLGLSDNVSYFVEQTDPTGVSTSHYAVTFKPEAIVPDVTVR